MIYINRMSLLIDLNDYHSGIQGIHDYGNMVMLRTHTVVTPIPITPPVTPITPPSSEPPTPPASTPASSPPPSPPSEEILNASISLKPATSTIAIQDGVTRIKTRDTKLRNLFEFDFNKVKKVEMRITFPPDHYERFNNVSVLQWFDELTSVTGLTNGYTIVIETPVSFANSFNIDVNGDYEDIFDLMINMNTSQTLDGFIYEIENIVCVSPYDVVYGAPYTSTSDLLVHRNEAYLIIDNTSVVGDYAYYGITLERSYDMPVTNVVIHISTKTSNLFPAQIDNANGCSHTITPGTTDGTDIRT